MRLPALWTAAQRLRRWAWDNPSAEHEARGILSASKLGIWLGLEILFLCGGAFAGFVLLPQEGRAINEAIVEVGTGQFLITTSLLTLTLFVTALVPLRAVGLIEGPRWRGYMDQVVTTGITPLRYFAGKVAVSQPLFLGLLLASLPLTTLFAMLGGVTLGRTLTAYALIYVYCNLLLVVTMALGVLLHEVFGLFCVLSSFMALGFLELLPFPSTIAALTPVRYLIQPFVETLAGSGAPGALELYGDPVVFGRALPWVGWALGLWVALGGLSLVTLCLGPLHRFLPGTNNFGAVVLPGDAKRLFFRRLRPLLTRRVELAFLFENRGPRLINWTLPLRAVQVLSLFAIGATVLLNFAYHPVVIRSAGSFMQLLGFESVALVVLMLSLVYTLCSGRSDVSLSYELTPRLRIPALWFDLAVFVIACALLVVIHSLTLAAAWPDLTLTPGMARYSSIESATDMVARSALLLAVTVVTSTILFFIGKLVACRVLNKDLVFAVCLLYLLALLTLPMMFFGAAEAVGRADDRSLHRYARPLVALAQASPAMPLFLAEEELPQRLGEIDHWLLSDAFWFWSLLQLLGFGVAALASNHSAYREARLVAGEARSTAPPCPGCGCQVATPLGWSWWGGSVLPLLLGYVRCLECRKEYSARSGTGQGGVIAGALVTRVVLSTLFVVGGLAWITGTLV